MYIFTWYRYKVKVNNLKDVTGTLQYTVVGLGLQCYHARNFRSWFEGARSKDLYVSS